VWAFGGALVTETAEDGGGGGRGNHRLAFHSLVSQLGGSAVKLPKEAAEGSGALVFDFFFNPETEELEHW
jgi:hypothetical protein